MSYLFTEELSSWSSWGKVFQSINAFRPLIKYIFQKENLKFTQIENCTPGTNAVFKVNGYIVKLFAPKESGMDTDTDFDTELFGMCRVNNLGVFAPKLVASGAVEDKYLFCYMVMEYIDGIEISEIRKKLTTDEKYKIGQKLRTITDKMNTSCEPFNNLDVINDIGRYKRWTKYPESFKRERLEYIKSHDFGEHVFNHGDLNGDNILLGKNGELYIIDFADAVLAPKSYEQALITCELFHFEKPYLHGYFGEYSIEELTELCFNGLLIHDFGGDVIKEHLGGIDDFHSLEDLRKRLFDKLR